MLLVYQSQFRIIFTLFFIIIFSFSIQAKTCDLTKKRISKIQYDGLIKTDSKVLEHEFELKEGDCVSPEMLEFGLQRVRNTNLFARVDIATIEGPYSYNVTLTIVERWTLIPILKFGGGGGVAFYTVGLYDPHVLGKNFELGAQYESLGGVPSQVVWFRKQRLFSRRIRVGGDLWNTTRNRLIYDKNRIEIGGFTIERKRFHFFGEYEIAEFVKPYAAIEYQKDKTSDKSISNKSKSNNVKYDFNPDTEGGYLIPRLGLYLGRMDIFEELIEGKFFDFQIEYVKGYTTETSFIRSRFEAQYAKRLSYRSNWAQRLIVSSQGTKQLSQLYYLGSIQDARGLLDSQFQTNKFLSLNSEVRIPSMVKSYILQHAFFADGLAFEKENDLKEAFAMGTGIRLIFPKVYRLNLRLDWAKSFGYGTGTAISFGLQQFF